MILSYQHLSHTLFCRPADTGEILQSIHSLGQSKLEINRLVKKFYKISFLLKHPILHQHRIKLNQPGNAYETQHQHSNKDKFPENQ